MRKRRRSTRARRDPSWNWEKAEPQPKIKNPGMKRSGRYMESRRAAARLNALRRKNTNPKNPNFSYRSKSEEFREGYADARRWIAKTHRSTNVVTARLEFWIDEAGTAEDRAGRQYAMGQATAFREVLDRRADRAVAGGL